MRVTRVLLDGPLLEGDARLLDATASTHLLRALRLRVGDALAVFDGEGHEADATLMAAEREGARVQLGEVRAPSNESPLRITLLQGVARGEKMDLILQKATELGAAAFVPVFTARSEVRLRGERADKRLAHWRGVVASACGQSGRARLPPVAIPLPLGQALSQLPTPGVRLMLDPAAETGCAGALPAGCREVVLAVGPEGGFSPQDRQCLTAAGFAGVRLGPRTLRTETAGLAALAALQAIHGDLN